MYSVAMTTTAVRNLSLSALLVGALGAGVVAAPAASAYPPGTGLSLASSTLTPRQGAYFYLTASHVKPGCYVTFSSSSRYFHGGRTKANSSGNAVRRVSFDKYGTFTVRATTTSGSCGGESDSIVITVSKSRRHR